MKYLKSYKLFESSNSEELLDLLRSDIEDIGFSEDSIYVSSCVFVCKKDGYPVANTKGIEWDPSFYDTHDEALRISNVSAIDINFTDIYTSNIGLTSMKYKKIPELNKKGIAIFHGPTFDESFNNGEEISTDDETAYEINTRYITKIYNGLNRARFNSYGYDYTLSSDPVGRKLIVIFKIGGDIKTKEGSRRSTWNPHNE